MRRLILIVVALGIASYVVWDRVEAHRLSNAIAAIAARGEPTRFDAGAPTPKTQEQRDAAALYAQAADAALEEDDNGRASRLDVDKPGGAELPLDDIRAAYRDDAPALQLLDRATPLDFGGFEVEQRENDSYAQSNLERGLSTLASIACLRADLASLRGNGDEAARALVPCIRLQRTVVYPQHRLAIADRILGSVRILLRHTTPSDEALVTLDRAMDSWKDVDRTVDNLMRDRAWFIEASQRPLTPGIVFSAARLALHPFVLRSARRSLAAFDGAVAIVRRPWAIRWAIVASMQRQLQQRAEQPPTVLQQITQPFAPVTPVNQYALVRSARELAARRLIAAALTVERYRRASGGAPPPSIEPREDPFSGRLLIYKKEADGYVLYSVDENGKDDGGILYGFGAAGLRNFGRETPRDYGIRVPLSPSVSGPRGVS